MARERVIRSQVRGVPVEVHESAEALGRAAAAQAAELIRAAIERCGRARLIVGTGNSQAGLIESLVQAPGLDWAAVEVFHMDEYVGIRDDHPASFRRWLRDRLAARVRPGEVHYLAGDAGDLAAEAERYAGLLRRGPIDLCFVGFGENGHIAFNEPGSADFHDPLPLKVVPLDDRTRRQQVGEGHFPAVAAVPSRAITLTCPTLMAARHVISCIPDRRKAAAVQAALTGPLTPACPASLVLTHPSVRIYLDSASASLLGLREEGLSH